MVATVICRDPAAMYHYLTGPVAALDGVHQVETTPVIRQVKLLAYDPIA